MKQRGKLLGKVEVIADFDGVIEDQNVVEENMNIAKKE